MKNFKILEKDKKIILLLCVLLILITTYVFVQNMREAKEIKKENETLQTRINELSEMEGKFGVAEQTSFFWEASNHIIANFPAGMTTEKCIMILNKLELDTGLKILSETFSMNEAFYTNATKNETIMGENFNYGDPLYRPFTAYQTTVMISFESTYEELKKAIYFINHYPERMTIGEIHVVGSEKETVSGNMNLCLFSLEGTKKVYQAPVVKDIELGVENIFGNKIEKEKVRRK